MKKQKKRTLQNLMLQNKTKKTKSSTLHKKSKKFFFSISKSKLFDINPNLRQVRRDKIVIDGRTQNSTWLLVASNCKLKTVYID